MESPIVMYGADWCPDCRRAKRFFAAHHIPYEWRDVERDPEARAFVLQANGGRQVIPTIVFPDGSLLVEPSDAELAARLGIPE